MSTTRSLVALASAVLLCAEPCGAQRSVSRDDLNGEWEGALVLEGGTHPLTLEFRLTDSAFVGTVYDGGRLFGPMERGTLTGNTVRFFIDKLVFTGTIDGHRMNVDLIVYNGSTRHFTATRKPAAPPPPGLGNNAIVRTTVVAGC